MAATNVSPRTGSRPGGGPDPAKTYISAPEIFFLEFSEGIVFLVRLIFLVIFVLANPPGFPLPGDAGLW